MKAIFLLCTLIGALCGHSLAANKPNIIVFLSDDHGMLDSTPYGSAEVRTPNMQRLADAGMTFTHAFIASPSCAPSRAAMLTGLMPARNGAENNHTFKRDDVASLPDVMRKLGYETAAFGKVAHGKDVARHVFDVFDPGKGDAIANAAKFLKARDASKPLCLFVGSRHPHAPWSDLEGYAPAKVTLPPKFVDTPETRNFRARYYTSVTKADTELGAVLDLAKEHFDPANTIFIYTSDHGTAWPFGKWNLYDTGIRVPFLAAYPGVFPAGLTFNHPVSTLDIFPTVTALAGVKQPADLDGVNLTPYLKGVNTASPHDALFFSMSGAGAVRQDRWKLFLEPDGTAQLYDLEKEVEEKHDLAATETKVVKELTEKWKTWNARMPQSGGRRAKAKANTEDQ